MPFRKISRNVELGAVNPHEQNASQKVHFGACSSSGQKLEMLSNTTMALLVVPDLSTLRT
ncbi:hypothetical protein AZE42_13706 [Rhizopogon vesiculosus]|uniref:Uncharacterized protein n=1 Tax=Rhizopogon vesiculosus TaxID=180088 RepID=A0A1J8QLI1_9AGAM|nr:hypothetical protein AZE42_13706 [Rhizopogon vesiculosus]